MRYIYVKHLNHPINTNENKKKMNQTNYKNNDVVCLKKL